ncbi:MAG: hypothetical protein NWS06_01700 [Candidatus Nanopelagicales bacterium]|jgi:hypothetical protein|nr:hypothetical protein [Candidatus Nanopelagicales bacterium]MDP4666720.1 hypothetical protein [Candidatus Nanopelagicales bacterium]
METLVMNMRWAGYLLIAFGLINWRYQNSFVVGAPLWIFGLALIIGTYVPAVHKLLVSKLGAAVVGLIILVLLVMAFIA